MICKKVERWAIGPKHKEAAARGGSIVVETQVRRRGQESASTMSTHLVTVGRGAG
jgi:hypothetical protein